MTKVADRSGEVTAQREARAAARDIGKIPATKDPTRRRKCAKSLLAFCKSYLPARFPLAFSDDHLRVIALLQRVIMRGGQFAIAMPRGSGKTTLFEAAVLWALLCGHRRFVMLIAADEGAADLLIASIRSELEHNDNLNDDFPEATYPIRALEGIARRAEGQTSDKERTLLVWNNEEIRLPRFAAKGGCVVRTAGITGRIRGAKAALADGAQIRPDLVLIDDPQTDESARSPSQVANRISTIQNTILGLSGPGESISCLCAVTVIAKGDLADQVLDRALHPEWQGVRTQLMHQMPKAKKLWDDYAMILLEDLREEKDGTRATAFYQKHQKDMDAGAEPSWPARKEREELTATQHAMNLLIKRGVAAFMAEYQNQPQDQASANEMPHIDAVKLARKVNHHKEGVIPIEGTTLTGFIDVQGAAVYYGLVAWAPGFSGDVITYGWYPEQPTRFFTIKEVQRTYEKELPGQPWEAALVAALGKVTDMLIGREWERDDGQKQRVDLLLIDANWGESTPTVYQFCRRSKYASQILPSHGRGIRVTQAPMHTWAKKPGDRIGLNWRIPSSTSRQTRHVIYETNFWKSFVAERLLAAQGSAACINLFGEDRADHRMIAAHCAAEYRVRVSANGRSCDEWHTKLNHDNHLWDVLVGSAVAASVRGVKIDEDGSQAREREAAKNPKPPPKAPTGGNGGWLGGFSGGLGGGGKWL